MVILQSQELNSTKYKVNSKYKQFNYRKLQSWRRDCMLMTIANNKIIKTIQYLDITIENNSIKIAQTLQSKLVKTTPISSRSFPKRQIQPE